MYENTTFDMYKYTATVVFRRTRLMNRYRSVYEHLKMGKHIERETISILCCACVHMDVSEFVFEYK